MIMIWQLVSPKDQRIYKIIELLFDSDQTVTINTIAKETNSSIRTIKYDLTDLKKILSAFFHLSERRSVESTSIKRTDSTSYRR